LARPRLSLRCHRCKNRGTFKLGVALVKRQSSRPRDSGDGRARGKTIPGDCLSPSLETRFWLANGPPAGRRHRSRNTNEPHVGHGRSSAWRAGKALWFIDKQGVARSRPLSEGPAFLVPISCARTGGLPQSSSLHTPAIGMVDFLTSAQLFMKGGRSGAPGTAWRHFESALRPFSVPPQGGGGGRGRRKRRPRQRPILLGPRARTFRRLRALVSSVCHRCNWGRWRPRGQARAGNQRRWTPRSPAALYPKFTAWAALQGRSRIVFFLRCALSGSERHRGQLPPKGGTNARTAGRCASVAGKNLSSFFRQALGNGTRRAPGPPSPQRLDRGEIGATRQHNPSPCPETIGGLLQRKCARTRAAAKGQS